MKLSLAKKVAVSIAPIAFLYFIIGIVLLPERMQIGWFAGYFLGLTSVIFHLFATKFIEKYSDTRILEYYFFTLFLRFIFVCSVFVFFLVATKIDEFSFTVSFIISYILHSVNEVIFLNQKMSYKSGR